MSAATNDSGEREELIQPTQNEAEVEAGDYRAHWQDGPNAKENVEDNIDESTPQKRVEAEAEEGRDHWQDGPTPYQK